METDNKENFALDLNCTFEGCTVIWDENEKLYICPCCGSKFSIDGKVVQGPATEDLPVVNL